MNYVLLLGAGFSRNWNGWLAEEIMGDVLGRVANDQELVALLNRVGNFEDALSHAQIRHKNERSPASKAFLDRLQGAILATFGAMNQAFSEMPSMEFSNHVESSIQAYLGRFHAIFSLNQDLLLELHYRPELRNPRFPNGVHFPGMQPPPNWQNTLPREKVNATWRPAQDLRVERGLQPIYKLHGSVNWRDRDGGELLVLGANKQGVIEEKGILNWYSDEFRRCLHIPDTRLMVVGYGFRDDHIDRLLYESWQRSRFGIFLANTRGKAVLNKQPQAAIRVPNPLEEIQLIGGSLRPLSTTFGNDAIERGKFRRFFVD